MPISYLLEAPVALAILLSTLLLSIIGLYREDFRDRHILVPYDMLIYKEYWRLITSGWFHGSAIHLMFNLLSFYFFAFMLEHRIGHWQLAVLYLASLLLSNLATTLRYRRDTGFEGSVGASGAISAVVLSAVLVNPFMYFGIPVLSDLMPFLRIPGYLFAAIYLTYSLVNSLRESELRINHLAHLGGALAGIVLTFLLKPDVGQTLQRWIGTF